MATVVELEYTGEGHPVYRTIRDCLIAAFRCFPRMSTDNIVCLVAQTMNVSSLQVEESLGRLRTECSRRSIRRRR